MPSTTNNSRGANRSRRSKNNNPQGHNQYNSGWMDSARERPMAAAAAAAAAVGAGVFLWSKRGQISDQLSQLSDQIGEWTENLSSEREFETVGGGSEFSGSFGSRASGDFGESSGTASSGATGDFGNSPTGSTRSGATSSVGTGSEPMSGSPLDSGPSGRGRK